MGKRKPKTVTLKVQPDPETDEQTRARMEKEAKEKAAAAAAAKKKRSITMKALNVTVDSVILSYALAIESMREIGPSPHEEDKRREFDAILKEVNEDRENGTCNAVEYLSKSDRQQCMLAIRKMAIRQGFPSDGNILEAKLETQPEADIRKGAPNAKPVKIWNRLDLDPKRTPAIEVWVEHGFSQKLAEQVVDGELSVIEAAVLQSEAGSKVTS